MDNPASPLNSASAAPDAPKPPYDGWSDDDLVYVDPDSNAVVGPLEWNKAGLPKSKLCMPSTTPEKEERRRRRAVFPWGTYRSMKNVFKVDGKPRRKDPTKTLEEVLPFALKEPYWD